MSSISHVTDKPLGDRRLSGKHDLTDVSFLFQFGFCMCVLETSYESTLRMDLKNP